MKVSEEKQAALRAAMERLLAGTPERSDGKLDVATLAREAGVSRATANRAAAVLAEFRRRVEERRAAEDPARTLREENTALKRELAALRQQRHREVQELRAGRRLDGELAAAAAEAGAPQRELDAAGLRPMLATGGEKPFRRAGWLFELKYDGVRALAEKRGAEARIFARNGAERTAQYPEIANALRHLPIEHAILDGEIVALDASGRSSFERIQRRFASPTRSCTN